jgi:hypothetical protein
LSIIFNSNFGMAAMPILCRGLSENITQNQICFKIVAIYTGLKWNLTLTLLQSSYIVFFSPYIKVYVICWRSFAYFCQYIFFNLTSNTKWCLAKQFQICFKINCTFGNTLMAIFINFNQDSCLIHYFEIQIFISGNIMFILLFWSKKFMTDNELNDIFEQLK